MSAHVPHGKASQEAYTYQAIAKELLFRLAAADLSYATVGRVCGEGTNRID